MRIVSPSAYVSPKCGGIETSSTAAFGAGVSGDSRQSTLWAGSWPSPSCDRSGFLDRTRIVPPLSSREFASTAMPCREMFGSTTVWTNVSSLVPLWLPLS